MIFLVSCEDVFSVFWFGVVVMLIVELELFDCVCLLMIVIVIFLMNDSRKVVLMCVF